MITESFFLILTLAPNRAIAASPHCAPHNSAPSSFSSVGREEAIAWPASYTQSEERININTASIADLARLPGIGPALASRIIEHRRKHGPFKRPQEIIVVRGLSARRYRQIAHLIRT